MTQKEIQDLIKYVSKSSVTEVEIEKKDFKIIIKVAGKGNKEENKRNTVYLPHPTPQMIPTQAPQVAPIAAAQNPVEPVVTSTAPVEDKNISIKSPMIGTFYRASSPEKPVFVEVGDMIKKGDVVCVIEAMKLFNEIEAEVSGRIVKVLVDDATPVEYDQPLFVVEPA